MKRRPFRPQTHNDVVRNIVGKAKYGTKVVFVPGNHDELLRDYDGVAFGNTRIADRAVHTRADGRRLLVLHGDQFDGVVRSSGAPAFIGSAVCEWLLRANRWTNYIRRKLDFPYWSLSSLPCDPSRFRSPIPSTWPSTGAPASSTTTCAVRCERPSTWIRRCASSRHEGDSGSLRPEPSNRIWRKRPALRPRPRFASGRSPPRPACPRSRATEGPRIRPGGVGIGIRHAGGI